MDDLTFAARRATAGSPSRPDDLDGRFRTLVQSPLRAGILRFLAARPNESFDIEALMQAFGRMRLDVENCVGELVEFGVVRRQAGDPPKFIAGRPGQDPMARLLDKFLERRAAVGIEETSPSVQRFREMIGRDEKMVAIFEWIRTAAKSDIAVLILGPTGSGKELVAQMIHELSRRGQERFQAVNCAALPDTLFESEIFGYEKGAFTGAHDRKPGRLELANGGTLLLDEIGDLSLVAQAKLLRVLEERRFERLGGNRSIHVDFRLISATNRPLDLFVREGRFREDLYYRINAFAIRLPSLRERSVDIPVLANRFLGRYCASNGLPLDAKQFSREADDLLISYHWPGNIRELEEYRVACRLVGAWACHSCRRHRVPARAAAATRIRAEQRTLHPSRSRARPHHACPRSRRMEQARSREGPGHQSWNALSEDRGVRPRTRGRCASTTRTTRRGVVANARLDGLQCPRWLSLARKSRKCT